MPPSLPPSPPPPGVRLRWRRHVATTSSVACPPALRAFRGPAGRLDRRLAEDGPWAVVEPGTPARPTVVAAVGTAR